MCACLLLALAVVSPVWAIGSASEVIFYSDALGMERTALVYLPEGYENSGQSYPVVYLVPGHAGTAGNWYSQPEFIDALDHLIGDGLVDPFIFVEIDPSCMPWAPDLLYPFPCHLADSELTGDHETSLIENLVPWIDSNYRSIADSEHRVIMGRSAGGYGAARAALRHPDLFGGLGLQVGLVALEPVQYMLGMLLAEYPSGTPYSYSPVAGEVSFMVFSWAAALTPNLANPPWNVDFLVDQDGYLDQEVWDQFAAQSTTRWAAEFAASGGELDIFMDYGTTDVMQPFTTVFAAALGSLDIPFVAQAFAGDHDDPPMWQRLQTHITYFFPLNATVELRPRVINARNRWIQIRASIELPGDLDVAAIDISSLAITEIDGVALDVPIPTADFSAISNINGNGCADLNVTFEKEPVLDAVAAMGITDQQPFTVTIEGETDLGWFFAATDSLRAVNLNHHNP